MTSLSFLNDVMKLTNYLTKESQTKLSHIYQAILMPLPPPPAEALSIMG
jgi:hypothetical protein